MPPKRGGREPLEPGLLARWGVPLALLALAAAAAWRLVSALSGVPPRLAWELVPRFPTATWVVIGAVAALYGVGAGMRVRLGRALHMDVLAPRDLTDALERLLWMDRLAEAKRTCERRPCCFSRLFLAGLAVERDGAENAITEAGAAEQKRIKRRLAALAAMGALAAIAGVAGGLAVERMDPAELEGALAQAGSPDPAERAKLVLTYQATICCLVGLVAALLLATSYLSLRGRAARRVQGAERRALEILQIDRG